MNYFPHKYCLLLNWRLIAIDVVSDQLIAVSYYVITALLLYVGMSPHRLARFLTFITEVGTWVLRWAVVGFALFIGFCAFTHQVSVWTIWHADYVLEAVVKVITAVLSLWTAVGFSSVVYRFFRQELESA